MPHHKERLQLMPLCCWPMLFSSPPPTLGRAAFEGHHWGSYFAPSTKRSEAAGASTCVASAFEFIDSKGALEDVWGRPQTESWMIKPGTAKVTGGGSRCGLELAF